MPLCGKQRVALLSAEVRHVYGGHGVRGNDPQHRTGWQCRQALARFEHRQRTQEPGHIEFDFGWVFVHALLDSMLQREGTMPPIMTKARFTGRIDQLLTAANRAAGLEKAPVKTLDLTFDGIPGDFHSGRSRPSDVRTIQLYPRDTPIANVRQLTIISAEELADVARAMAIPALPPGWLGGNMMVSGIPDFTRIPPSTRLQFPSGAVLVIDMENFPCRQVSEVIAKTHPDEAMKFVAAARHKRGVTAWVEREGPVAVGYHRVVSTAP